MYDSKVMFSLFPPLNVRNQILAKENNRHNYHPKCISLGVLDGDLAEKNTETNGNKFPLSLKRPTFICKWSSGLLNLAHAKYITYVYIVKFF